MQRRVYFFGSLLLSLAAGCQGAGSRSSVFSPGTGKVPPPATGSFGSADKGYFNNPSGSGTTGSSSWSGTGSGAGSGIGTSGSGGGVRPSGNSRSSTTDSSGSRLVSNGQDRDDSDWRPLQPGVDRSTPVAAASFERDDARSGSRSGASSSSSLLHRLRGMPANDATGPTKSARELGADESPMGANPIPPRRMQIADDDSPNDEDSIADDAADSSFSSRSDSSGTASPRSNPPRRASSRLQWGSR